MFSFISGSRASIILFNISHSSIGMTPSPSPTLPSPFLSSVIGMTPSPYPAPPSLFLSSSSTLRLSACDFLNFSSSFFFLSCLSGSIPNITSSKFYFFGFIDSLNPLSFKASIYGSRPGRNFPVSNPTCAKTALIGSCLALRAILY